MIRIEHGRVYTSLVGAILSILFGLIFVAVGIVFLNAPKVDYVETTGEITDFDHAINRDSPEVIVRFTVEEKEYNVHYPEYWHGMKVGDVVEVLYNPADPREVRTKGTMALPYVAVGFGAFLSVLGIALTVWIVKSKKKEKKISGFL